MATFTETIDDLYISTWQEMKKQVVDNIFASTPFYFWMKKKGRIMEDHTGGKWLGIPLMVGKNETVAMYQKGGSFPVTRTDKLDLARYEWKYMGGSLIRYKVDELENRGKAKIIDRMMVELDNLKLTIVEKMENYLLGDGTAEGGLAFNGLDIICVEDPTAVITTAHGANAEEVGGIPQLGNPYWRNVYRQMDTDGTVVSLNMMESIKYAYRTASNGSDRPDIFITTPQILDWYDDECLDIKVISNTMLGDAGFENLTWRGIPFVTSDYCKSGSLYMLNTKYMAFIAQAGANFAMTEWKTAPDTLDRYAQIFVSGNLVTSNRARQAVVFDID